MNQQSEKKDVQWIVFFYSTKILTATTTKITQQSLQVVEDKIEENKLLVKLVV